MWGPRVLVCCVLVACAGDQRLDPSALELRDVLGISPDTALAWDAGQRAAARHVIDAAMHDAATAPVHASLGLDPALDRRIAHALAAADADREKHHLPALGVVQLALAHDDLQVASRRSTLAPRGSPIELQFAGWSDRPGWATLPARGLDVLSTIARDAGHRSGPLVVTPAPQLAVVAGYLAATPGAPARLVVNPVVLAALEPATGPAVTPPAVARVPIAPSDGIGNPYTFYSSVGECAAAQQTRCETCLPSSTCSPLAGTGDGNAECTQLAAEPQDRGYSLVCINFALAIDSVNTCTAAAAPTCPRDSHAANSLSYLEHNADFLDQAQCASALDQCLEAHAGATPVSTPPPASPSTSCSDSACEAAPSCDGGGDSGCDGSSCDSSGGDSSGDSCSSDSSSSSCDSSSCSGDSGGGCSDSGGDCSGDSGGDCSGGGGDCSGGGGDCNAGSRRHRGDSHGYLWACLPLPFAVIARRRAERRRARREVVA